MENSGIVDTQVSIPYPVIGRAGTPDVDQNTMFRVVTAALVYYRFDNDLLGLSIRAYTTSDLMVYVRLGDVTAASGRGAYFSSRLAKDGSDMDSWRQACLHYGIQGARPVFIPVEDAVRLLKAHMRDNAAKGSVIGVFKSITRTVRGLRGGKYEAYGLPSVSEVPDYLSVPYKRRTTRPAEHNTQPVDKVSVDTVAVAAEAEPPEQPVCHAPSCPDITTEALDKLKSELGHLIATRQEAQKRAEIICKALGIPTPW